MPAFLDQSPSNSSARLSERQESSIRIGLVNNMPDGALEATERQFLSLLDRASGALTVRVSLYALPDVPRAAAGRQHIERFYSSIGALLEGTLDGLIVTGAEPRASNLSAEPYWESLATVIEWAEHNTHSAIWSCLAAHAAVLHLDGIQRWRMEDKHFGVFECSRASDHFLTRGLPSVVPVPHSRWNDLRSCDLKNCGYDLLTLSDQGVDIFVKRRKSLFVFFQGHPEYDADTLLLEYRRDVGRYIKGERDSYPPIPLGYLPPKTAADFERLRLRALSGLAEERHSDLQAATSLSEGIANTWHTAAASVYSNWLHYLCGKKNRATGKEQRMEAPVGGNL